MPDLANIIILETMYLLTLKITLILFYSYIFYAFILVKEHFLPVQCAKLNFFSTSNIRLY